MWQYNAHDAIRLQMIKIMKQKSIISLALRCDPIIIEARIGTVWCIPTLRIRRIRNARIYKQRLIGLRVTVLEKRPVFSKRIPIASDDIVGLNATHDQIHTREIVSILLELLSIVLNAANIARTMRHRLTNIDKQRS